MHITLCDYLLDIGQNSFEAKADDIHICLRETETLIELVVKDNGCGMDEETLAKAVDPFFSDPEKHAARKAGFGLPFLIQAAEGCDGGVTLESKQGVGTTVSCHFASNHIDTPPLGDVVTTVVALMSMDGEYNLTIEREKNGNEYTLTREDLLDALGDLHYADSLALAKAFVTSEEDELK